MIRICLILALIAPFHGCTNMDPTERAVLSDKPMSESTGATLQDLNQRQTNDTRGMEQAGSLNQYEEEQMEQAVGPTH